MSFDTLGLSAGILRAVADEGYSIPTPAQSQAIPAILQGRHVMVRAQTGTGKTAAFALPILERLSTAASGNSAQRLVRALVLTPTRELACQVEEAVRVYGRHLSLRTGVVYGGVGIGPQIGQLRRGVDILVATPGRLLDHITRRTLDLSRVEILVLDEADRMLDMGFLPDVRKIMRIAARGPTEPVVLGELSRAASEARGFHDGLSRPHRRVASNLGRRMRLAGRPPGRAGEEIRAALVF